MFKITLAITAVMVALSGNLAAADKGTVLVAGAGKSGKPLIKILVDQGYKVRVLTREAADLGNGVTVVVGDVTKPATLAPAVKGVDFVVSTIGAGSPQGDNRPEVVDFKGVANLVDAAKAAKVKQFVLMSSLGAGSSDPNVMLNKIFGMVLMWKGQGEDHLRKSGLPYTIVRPGGLKDCDPGKTGIKFGTDPAVGSGAICRADVGLVMAAALGNAGALGKTVGVIGEDGTAATVLTDKFASVAKDK